MEKSPFITLVFQGIRLLWLANILKQEAECLPHKATQLEAEGLQQIEGALAGSGLRSSMTSSRVPWLTLICPLLWFHLYPKGRGRLPW